jgi:uncharacterized protein (TIGR01319 family)
MYDLMMVLKDIRVILATDCGSTTSKARFFKKLGGEYRFIASGEAPTTVEAPYEDVTLGVRNAVREVEELTGHKLLAVEGIMGTSKADNIGADIYVTTSSAGGGLQMVVMGLIKTMTAESAERAALGAGAITMDTIALDDGREPHEKIEVMRFLRPDMILFAGGTDEGDSACSYILDLAQFLRTANPQARFGASYTLPVVYAGNKNVRTRIDETWKDRFAVRWVDNIRPTLNIENVEPAREAIHELFMEHVMSHAPGYDRLMKWTPVPIMPTPAGEGTMFQVFARANKVNLIGVGLGGATTNVYSVYDGKFVRSVSANLGMSYSICNVLKEAGLENITRWLPFETKEETILNSLYNKMIRPTIIPQTLDQLMIEHAVAREALRLGFKHHKTLARPLFGTTLSDEERFKVLASRDWDRTATYIDMLRVDCLGGTGGLLSHAPRRVQSMMILIDGFQVEGVTRLFQDSVFMMPHLGVLSTVHPKAALEIFEKDCLVPLGTCIAFRGVIKEGEQNKDVATIRLRMPDGETIERRPAYGTIERIPLKVAETAQAEIHPDSKFDVGAGYGKRLVKAVQGGVVGIIIDARGRPLDLPTDDERRISRLREWSDALNVYPRRG